MLRRECRLTTNQFQDVSAHFEARQDTLLARWRDLVRADPTLPDQRVGFTDEELEDHLPALLRALIDALRNERLPENELEQRGAQHGHTRRMHGYQVAQVAWEFALFRQLVRQTLEELASTRSSSTLFTVRELLMRLIDRSEFASIEQYVREAAQERDAAREQLRVAGEQKDRFLAVLSHELRNPLAAILAALHILRNEDIAKSNRERALGVIDRQARAQTRLIDDLLDVNRISQGKIELKRETLDLRKSIENTIEGYLSAIEARGIRFRFVRPDHHLRVFADSVRVEQIVSNLLGNALKFTQAGGSIEISIQTDSHDAVIRVRDTGAGLDRSMLDRLFEPFAEAEANMRNGLGLGLWLAKQLTEMHGGTIQVSSEGLDKGTEVTVHLPGVSEETARKEPLATRVLVVEDDPDQREMMELALSAGEIQVVSATNAAEALELTSEKLFDIYILDLDLPDTSGYQLATKVLQLHREGRPLLIALSGYGRLADASTLKAAGFDHHLVKPAEIESLQRLIHSRTKR